METLIKQTVGKNIRALRNRQGLSQEKFAKICGLDRTYIASVELGKRNISIVNLEKIANALNVSAAELLNVQSNSILLNINGVQFLLKSPRVLTDDEKENLEYICRCAFEEDSDLITGDENPDILRDESPYELADRFTAAAEEENIPVRFCPIDLELSIFG